MSKGSGTSRVANSQTASVSRTSGGGIGAMTSAQLDKFVSTLRSEAYKAGNYNDSVDVTTVDPMFRVYRTPIGIAFAGEYLSSSQDKNKAISNIERKIDLEKRRISDDEDYLKNYSRSYKAGVISAETYGTLVSRTEGAIHQGRETVKNLNNLLKVAKKLKI